MADDGRLEGVAARVFETLKEMNAVGSASARKQTEVARACGVSTRRLQTATLALNRAGIAVLSTCHAPYGVYLAETDDEITDYCAQLRARLVGNAARRRAVRKILAQRIALRSVEPDGQGRLFL